MIDDSELVVQKHQLKLQIQKTIVENLNNVKNTQDIGRTTWEIAEKIVGEIMKRKQDSKQTSQVINKFLKKVVDFDKAQL